MGKENGKNGRSINSTSSDNDLTLVADDQRPNKDSRKDTDTLDVIPDELLRTESIHSNSSTLPVSDHVNKPNNICCRRIGQ